MMLKDIKEMFECDVVGNDEEYIKKVNLTDKDFYNIKRMAESVKYNTTELYYDQLCCACALLVYLVHKGKTEELGLSYLREDLEETVDTYLQVLYNKAYQEYLKIDSEGEEDDASEDSSGNCKG